MNIENIKSRFGIIGHSPKLNYALEIASKVANTDLSVLITGESGVGKEVFSQVIHQFSARKHQLFIAVNCGAIPEGTIDSELFGHEKGSFTGAVDQRKGYFETVNGGTIFLDEIGEMPVGTQSRLLRVLETGEYLKVGSSKVEKTNVRIIAATNKNLLVYVDQYKFREDLYYRLNTVPILIPALRERKEDIPLLFKKFASNFAHRYHTSPIQLEQEAMEKLVNYGFPGNIRELKNIAEQISVLATEKKINLQFFNNFIPDNNYSPSLHPTHLKDSDNMLSKEQEILYQLVFELKKEINDLKKFILQNVPFSDDDNPITNNTIPTTKGFDQFQLSNNNNTPIIIKDNNKIDPINNKTLKLVDIEKKMIIETLKKNGGRRKETAEKLGISERTLYRKIIDYNIES
ncbi:MAG: sigma-54 interaction domain-containing protein [Chitinophagaceae bacterium]